MFGRKLIFMYAVASIILLLTMLSGCAKTPPYSGFLKDYSLLQQDPEDQSLLWWEKDDVNWKRYTKLMLDPVVVYFHPESQDRQIEPDVLKMLCDYFRESVIEQVQDVYPVVEQAGPEVLRIRAAITDLIPTNPVVNAVSLVGVGLPVDMGGASMEAEFLDSLSAEPLGAVVDQKKGLPVNPGDIVDGFTTWGHAQQALDDWAELLREALLTTTDTGSTN